MNQGILGRIQQLQFHDKEEAERLLIGFLRDVYRPDVVKVEIRPLAVSLNSFNGFLWLQDGRQEFFKTHIESDSVITEYYNTQLLDTAGYPIIRPVFSSTASGRQLLIYKRVESPSVFDLAWQIEQNLDSRLLATLTAVQQESDRQLFNLYQRTLTYDNTAEASRAPIHQLFYHRLVGGRLDHFYGGEETTVNLPYGQRLLAHIREQRWLINGRAYPYTLNEYIQQVTHLLQPTQLGPVVVGHGDAHNGNVFFSLAGNEHHLVYFDPAFAGRHHPLLDLVKPLFHNVFAMWMYFPEIIDGCLNLASSEQDGQITVEYDDTLPPLRLMFLESKLKHVLSPLLAELRQRGWLRHDWKTYLKAGLFCCPFLTMNLADPLRYPPRIALLGLVMAIEMGGISPDGPSIIDSALQTAETASL